MTLDQIKLKIGERCDDDTGNAYASRYEGIFISAMIDVIKSVDKNGNSLFSESEYPELVEPYNKELSISDGFSKILYSEIDAIFVRDVYTDPSIVNINSRINFQKRTLPELENIRNSSYLCPSTGEGYWAEKGDAVFILVDAESRAIRVSFDKIKSPSAAVWGDQDLHDDYHYGNSFIWACIKQAANILKSEIGLE